MKISMTSCTDIAHGLSNTLLDLASRNATVNVCNQVVAMRELCSPDGVQHGFAKGSFCQPLRLLSVSLREAGRVARHKRLQPLP